MVSALEEIKKMQRQGLSEDRIIADLREKGFPHKDILEALSQTKIKAAVEQEDSSHENMPMPSAQSYSGVQGPEITSGDDTMEQSLLSQTPAPEQNRPTESYWPQQPQQSSDLQAIPAQQGEEYGEYGTQYPEQEYSNYTDNSYYQQGYSSDIISEISEQIVAEKLSEIRKGVEKIIDFKTTVESRVETLGERLLRIEKIIDTLQSSVLRKVGDYVTNVDDIKKEMIETQKTFARLLPELRTSSQKKPKKHIKKEHKEK